MKNAHGRTCKKTKVHIYLYISLYENLFENGCIYIYIYIYIKLYCVLECLAVGVKNPSTNWGHLTI